MKFIENLIDRIAAYLPDDEPATEAERLYEEGKERIYELHQWVLANILKNDGFLH